MGWASEGRSLLFQEFEIGTGRAILYATDETAATPRIVETGCASPCEFDEQFSVSVDGRTLAFVRNFAARTPPTTQVTGVVATMDLASGRVAELESTATSRTVYPELGPPCDTGCFGDWNSTPRFSPDGRSLVFSQFGFRTKPRTDGPVAEPIALLIVDRDGTNLRQLVPVELFGREATWSPDGSRIAFTSAVQTIVKNPATGDLDMAHWENDIYTVRPDGTDLRRLTSDGNSVSPNWTADGRLVYLRIPVDEGNNPISRETWSVDADGSRNQRVDAPDLATLTDLGCIWCPQEATLFEVIWDSSLVAAWQPRP